MSMQLNFNKTSFESINNSIEELMQICAQSNVSIHANSQLHKGIETTREMYLKHRVVRKGIRLLPENPSTFNEKTILMAWTGRLAEILLSAYETPCNQDIIIRKYLPLICKHPFVPGSPTGPSEIYGKDYLYELYFADLLNKMGYSCQLKNEPDNIVSFPSGAQFGFHFKHPYNKQEYIIKNFEDAFQQAKKYYPELPKFIFIALDDIFPHKKFYSMLSTNRLSIKQGVALVDDFIIDVINILHPLATKKHIEYPNLVGFGLSVSSTFILDNLMNTLNRMIIRLFDDLSSHPHGHDVVSFQKDISNLFNM